MLPTVNSNILHGRKEQDKLLISEAYLIWSIGSNEPNP